MKILIGADSRGIWPKYIDELDPGYNWIDHLKLSHSGAGNEIYTCRAEYELPIFSLEQLRVLMSTFVPNNTYDLIILQSGWHDGGVCPWPRGMHKQIHPKTYHDEYLCGHLGLDGKYTYVDREAQRDHIDFFKQKAKNVLFVGMHSLKGKNTLTDTYKLDNKHHYDMLKMNNSFTLPGVHFLNMPMDATWKDENKYPSNDGIHYNNNGGKFIADYIKRHIARTDKTIQNVLQNSVNHSEFYKKAKAVGSQICELTSEGDIVVLSRPSSEQLFLEFIGCILFNRKPVILQYPSEKVEFKEFNKKMIYVKNKLSPSLCLCDKEHLSNYKNYFNSFDVLALVDNVELRSTQFNLSPT